MVLMAWFARPRSDNRVVILALTTSQHRGQKSSLIRLSVPDNCLIYDARVLPLIAFATCHPAVFQFHSLVVTPNPQKYELSASTQPPVYSTSFLPSPLSCNHRLRRLHCRYEKKKKSKAKQRLIDGREGVLHPEQYQITSGIEHHPPHHTTTVR